MRRLSIAAVLLCLAPAIHAEEPTRDPHAAAREARDLICARLSPLADELARFGDATAAQAVAETYLWVAGVPHSDQDALREAIKTHVARETPRPAMIAAAWKQLASAIHALGASTRDWDVLDARLVAQLPEVLPCVRQINAARLHGGLTPMRYDAKRCIGEIKRARQVFSLEGGTGEEAKRLEAGRLLRAGIPGLVTKIALRVPAMRLALFDPQDKGLKIGTWPREHSPAEAADGPAPAWFRLATALAPSGNRDPLATTPRVPFVYPRPSEPLPRVLSGSFPLAPPRYVPAPVTLHGFGSRPNAGAQIRVTVSGQEVKGTSRLIGNDGAWAIAFTFGFLAKGDGRVALEFTARHADGRVIKRWTMTAAAK